MENNPVLILIERLLKRCNNIHRHVEYLTKTINGYDVIRAKNNRRNYSRYITNKTSKNIQSIHPSESIAKTSGTGTIPKSDCFNEFVPLTTTKDSIHPSESIAKTSGTGTIPKSDCFNEFVPLTTTKDSIHSSESISDDDFKKKLLESLLNSGAISKVPINQDYGEYKGRSMTEVESPDENSSYYNEHSESNEYSVDEDFHEEMVETLNQKYLSSNEHSYGFCQTLIHENTYYYSYEFMFELKLYDSEKELFFIDENGKYINKIFLGSSYLEKHIGMQDLVRDLRMNYGKLLDKFCNKADGSLTQESVGLVLEYESKYYNKDDSKLLLNMEHKSFNASRFTFR